MANILIVEDEKNMRDIIYEYMHRVNIMVRQVLPQLSVFILNYHVYVVK